MAKNAEGQRPTTDRHDRGRRWLIDGMNLIGSRPDGWWHDPDRAIRRLIEELDRCVSATGQDVTVVFDHRPSDVRSGTHGTVLVVFAPWQGRNAADHEIVRIVRADHAPDSMTVVTSDRRLIERVRELGARVMSSTSFRRRLIAALESGRATGM
jgi:predicted RNA-binding protein with PIN domain